MNISIAMTTYNGERFVREQLRSLAEQTHPPLELVIGDDGSTDRTVQILEEFAASARFPVSIQQNTSRLGYANNFLFTAQRCRGDWIAFCDQDDMWLAHKLHRIGCLAQENPEAQLIVTGIIHTDSSLRPVSYDPPLSCPDGNFFRLFHSPSLKTFQGNRMAFKRSLLHDYPWQSRPAGADGAQLAHDRWIGTVGLLFGNRCFSAEHLTLYRRHDSAVTFGQRLPPVAALREVRRGAKKVLADETKLWSDLSLFFLAEAEKLTVRDADCFRRASDFCNRASKLCALRMQIFSVSSRVQKMRSLLNLLSQGALKEFGPLNLTKDVFEAMRCSA